MTDLRSLLGAPKLPEFSLTLPKGWERREVSDETTAELVTRLRNRLAAAHRPDLLAVMRAEVTKAMAQMKAEQAFAIFGPFGADDDTLMLPTSITARWRSADPGETLDQTVATLIRSHGGTPLFGDPRTVRIEQMVEHGDGEERIVMHSLVYLIPVPGSGRTRALQLNAGVPRPANVATDDDSFLAACRLIDVCVATLEWQMPIAQTP